MAAFTSMTFGRALRAAAGRDPNKIAICFGSATLTFAELVRRAEAVRDVAITALGIKKGDNVALVARNCLEFMEIVAGIPDAGAALATINPRLTAREIAATIADCGAKIVFTAHPWYISYTSEYAAATPASVVSNF